MGAWLSVVGFVSTDSCCSLVTFLGCSGSLVFVLKYVFFNNDKHVQIHPKESNSLAFFLSTMSSIFVLFLFILNDSEELRLEVFENALLHFELLQHKIIASLLLFPAVKC
jgi:hypothetical protein